MRMIDADALSRIVKLAWDTSDSKDFEKSVFIAIATAPTIEERKKGEWIKMPYHVTECSECGFSLEDWIQGAFYNYCPNCGADMRGDI